MHSSVAMFISGWRLVSDRLLLLDRLVAVGFGWLGVVGWLRPDWLACLACLVDCDWIESLLLAGFGFSAIF